MVTRRIRSANGAPAPRGSRDRPVDPAPAEDLCSADVSGFGCTFRGVRPHPGEVRSITYHAIREVTARGNIKKEAGLTSFFPILVLPMPFAAATEAGSDKIGTPGIVFGILGSSPMLQKLLGCSAIRSAEERGL